MCHRAETKAFKFFLDGYIEIEGKETVCRALQCGVTWRRAVTGAQAAALCVAVGDWTPRCFCGLNRRTHNFFGLEAGKNAHVMHKSC